MFLATDLAVEKLNEYMQSNNVTSAIRVFPQAGGCSGPSLALALDEKKTSDEEFTKEGVTFLVDQGLMVQCGDITVDFIDAGTRSGFTITSSIPLPGGGCSSGSCGSGGCGH